MIFKPAFFCLLPAGFAVFAACNNPSPQAGEDAGNSLFTLLKPEQTNIGFQNTLTEGLNTNILMYEYFYNGGGVAAGDFNNDGLVDLYFSSNMSDNKFYLNKGKMEFLDITEASGAAGRPGPWKTGVNTVDINADGRLDLYLCYSGAMPAEKRMNQLFINTGNDENGIPRFEEGAAEYGLASTGFSNQSYFFDYDKDGDLDMLLLNHNPKNLPIQNIEATKELFKRDNPEKGLRLYKQTNGRFEDVTRQAGINGSELSYGLGVGISDFNGDGWPDFYVSNDYSVPDFLYINNKNGTFTNDLEKCIGHTSQFSMGNDVADINNDGLQDIYTLDMLPEDNRRQKLLLTPDNYSKFDLNVSSGFYYQYMRNMLHVNNGDGSFSETGQQAGVSNTDWSWAALLADYDNDGWKDLFVTNGYLRDYTNLDFLFYMNNYVQEKGRLMREDVMEIVKQMPSSNVVNYIYQNNRDGKFENKTKSWRMNRSSNSNGAVYADLDNDGDLDIVVNNINQPAFIYQNEAQKQSGNNFLQVRLSGNAGNTLGLGARVKIFHDGQIQTLEQYPARGYLSAVSSVLQFGLSKSQKTDSLIITWNSGKQQRLYNIKANGVIQLAEKDATENAASAQEIQCWFTQVPSAISYKDPARLIHDFNRQLLLISEFSHSSPCMIKYDLNGDKREDVLIGGANGEATRIYLQQPNGSFGQMNVPAFEVDKAFEDADIAVFDANGDHHPDIYISSGGYHSFSENDPLLQDRLYLNDGKNNFSKSNSLPAMTTSKSSVRVEDINGDGAPDLFVGGRVVPGRYPETPRSYILINDGKGNFSDQTEKICPELVKPGMVTDAAWTDLDLDKQNELVIAGEWMPVMVFNKEGGKLVNVSDKYFEKKYSGWWNKMAVGDFNADGRPDLVIGNMGLNTQFSASEKEPLEMFYKDFDKNGSVDPIFSFYIQHKKYPYLTRDELVTQLPVMRKRFADFKSYADVTLDELFLDKDEFTDAGHLTAGYMSSTCFISNASGKYKAMELPKEVQYSPIYAIEVLDYDEDGNADLLLCGNNSHFKIRLGKFDANYGVLLRGDGKGNFIYIPQTESGFIVRGDVRSCLQINKTIYFGINGSAVAAYKLTGIKK
jgi:enediyne biosynthesis protein E4